MGWASASEIFDPVAQTLVDLNADAANKRALLTMLIDKLRDLDWDTWDESLQAWRTDPAIVSAFYTALDGVELHCGGSEGVITYVDGEWVISCLGCDETLGSDAAVLDDIEWSVKVHNNLLQVWAKHDRERHNGSGKVPEWVLIGGAR
jgi:hypothetical protein